MPTLPGTREASTGVPLFGPAVFERAADVVDADVYAPREQPRGLHQRLWALDGAQVTDHDRAQVPVGLDQGLASVG
jgi:hypothetical protein